MPTAENLRQLLYSIDGAGYKAYKRIEGVFSFPGFTLFIDHAQGDPFASPSRVRVRKPLSTSGIPSFCLENKERQIALRDYLARRVGHFMRKLARGHRGTGNSGAIYICHGGQEILERSAVVLEDDQVEMRFYMGLPASGRRVLGREAAEMFFKELPAIIDATFSWSDREREELLDFVRLYEDQEYLRHHVLPTLGLVAFVADGAILPRESGISEKPLPAPQAVPFVSPPSLQVTVDLIHRKGVRGMGIKKGVTVITGGGFHGKSTLLRALEKGVYNHIPGDGRELVITDPTAFKIRAEDGRRISGTSISFFITNLPFQADTDHFFTENASGSTSQAANIMEALEAGSRLLLIDEDTSATNFMIRDQRMQRLISRQKEPITPFIDRVRELYENYGVSSVIVIGGSGDYLEVADTVILMDNYRAHDVSEEARRIVAELPGKRLKEALPPPPSLFSDRKLISASLNPQKGSKIKAGAKARDKLEFGREILDIRSLEQIVDAGQTRAIAKILARLSVKLKSHREIEFAAVIRMLKQLIENFEKEVNAGRDGDLVVPRLLETVAVLNRMRSLRFH
ncbi:MAG: hypothetical protein PWQ31_1756 [Eubacteriales bacterium]|nr:hypothetical protein [Eubacteriales bacterium]